MSKRPVDVADELALVDTKRVRFSNGDVADRPSHELAIQPRRHFLRGPIMLLTGHDSEIFSAKFHPSGTSIASAGSDRSIYLWTTRGDCENYAILKSAHSNTITDLAYSIDGDRLFSCSADKTVIMWDSRTGCRLKKLRNHQSHVNSISASPSDANLLVSVGDDNYVNIWDVRKKRCALSFKEKYQLTASAFSKTSDQIFVGGIENVIKVWDLKGGNLHYSMTGHSDTITGLALSPDGQHLLSNSMDNTLKCWDVKSRVSTSRLVKNYSGHQHNFEKNLLRCSWSPNGRLVTAGSSDRNVYIWSFKNCDIMYRLPGHRGTVNEVVFSPREPLVLSCSSDKNLYLGEVNYDLV